MTAADLPPVATAQGVMTTTGEEALPHATIMTAVAATLTVAAPHLHLVHVDHPWTTTLLVAHTQRTATAHRHQLADATPRLTNTLTATGESPVRRTAARQAHQLDATEVTTQAMTAGLIGDYSSSLTIQSSSWGCRPSS